MQTLDHVGLILDLSAHVERLAEQCELECSLAWDHLETVDDDLIGMEYEGE